MSKFQLTQHAGWPDSVCRSIQVVVLQRSCDVLSMFAFPSL